MAFNRHSNGNLTGVLSHTVADNQRAFAVRLMPFSANLASHSCHNNRGHAADSRRNGVAHAKITFFLLISGRLVNYCSFFIYC